MNSRHPQLLAFVATCCVVAVTHAQEAATAKHSAPAHERPITEAPHQAAILMGGTGTVSFSVTTASKDAQRFFEQGIGQVHAASYFQAERSFRQVLLLDPKCAMAWWGMAVANVHNPSRAVWFLWEAYGRRKQTSPRERLYIDAYARCFGAEKEPPTVLVDAERGSRRAIPTIPTREQRKRLQQDLAAVAKAHPEDVEAKAFLLRERLIDPFRVPDASPREDARLLQGILGADRFPPFHPAIRYEALLSRGRPAAEQPHAMAFTTRLSACKVGRMWSDASLVYARAGQHDDAAACRLEAARAWHARMLRTGEMPYDVRGYSRNGEQWCKSLHDAGRFKEAVELVRYLTALPRHSRTRGFDAAQNKRLTELAARMKQAADRPSNKGPANGNGDRPSEASLGPARWTPQKALDFKLPIGMGGEATLSKYAGQPVLVVFFLGFGCVHCVEQLGELSPRALAFRRAGIKIVTIGTDTVEQVKASIQAGIENDAPQLPFPVLCDPKHEIFKSWRCWDDFKNEALHGTFLIDGKGRIRWQDISIDPFMQTDFLLQECKRLLALPEGK